MHPMAHSGCRRAARGLRAARKLITAYDAARARVADLETQVAGLEARCPACVNHIPGWRQRTEAAEAQVAALAAKADARGRALATLQNRWWNIMPCPAGNRVRAATIAELAGLGRQEFSAVVGPEWEFDEVVYPTFADAVAAAAGVPPALLADAQEPQAEQPTAYHRSLDLVLRGEQAQRAGDLAEAAHLFREAGAIQERLVAALPADRPLTREVFGQSAAVLKAKAEALERAAQEPQAAAGAGASE